MTSAVYQDAELHNLTILRDAYLLVLSLVFLLVHTGGLASVFETLASYTVT